MFAIFVFFCLLHGIVLDVIPIYVLVALPIAEVVCIVSFFVVFSELLQTPIMPWAADPNDPAKGPKLMLAAFLLAVFVIVIECGAIIIRSHGLTPKGIACIGCAGPKSADFAHGCHASPPSIQRRS